MINADAISNKNNVLQEILSDAVLSDNEKNLKTIFYHFKDVRKYKNLSQKKNKKYKKDKYKKLLALFNIHVDLHLTNMTREYVTIINLNILLYKIKYI